MTEDDTDKLKGIFLEIFPKTNSPIGMDTKSTDIEAWDSMAHIQLISKIEEHFNIEFEIDELLAFDSFANIHDVLDKKLKG